MPENRTYPPEGLAPPSALTLSDLQDALRTQTVLEGTAVRCDADLNLVLSAGGLTLQMPRAEVTAPWISGAGRDIAVLSRVGRPVSFRVERIAADEKGAPIVTVSRRRAQEAAMEQLLTLRPGTVLLGRVVRMEPFGAFVDIGRGIVALLPTEYISAARIPHPSCRFREGQRILVVLRSADDAARRITLTHRELLGTWLENASRFAVGETVPGIVRGVQDYGCFVELTPNLSGLTEARSDLAPGDAVSVTIRSIRPERMKIKLQTVERLPAAPEPAPLRYQITDGVLDRWVYSPADYAGTPVAVSFSKNP